MSAIPFLVGIAILLFFVQSTVLGLLIPMHHRPDLFAVVVLWAALRMHFLVGLGLSFLGGMMLDVLSGSPTGLFAIAYSMIYMGAGQLHSVAQVDSPSGRGVMTAVAALTVGAMVLGVRSLMGPIGIGWHTAAGFAGKAMWTGLASLALFPLVERLWNTYCRVLGIRA